MKIGFFDSGVGGLTVLSRALKECPNYEYLYYGDFKHAPYGVKSPVEVKLLTINAIDFLIDKGAEIIVIACNTATSIAINDLREKYTIPIIGMEPAVKPAIELVKKKKERILITATPLTLKGNKIRELIHNFDQDQQIDLCPLPKLVEFAESLNFHEDEIVEYLNGEFSNFPLEKYRTVVLGCTHFSLFFKQLKRVLPNGTILIDGSRGTINRLKEFLPKKTVEVGKIIYYNSGNEVSDSEELLKYNYIIEKSNDSV